MLGSLGRTPGLVSSGAEMNPISDRRGVPARVSWSLLAQARVIADYQFLAEHCGAAREEIDAVTDDDQSTTISGAAWAAHRTTCETADDANSSQTELLALKELFGAALGANARVRFLDSLRSDLSECNSAIA